MFFNLRFSKLIFKKLDVDTSSHLDFFLQTKKILTGLFLLLLHQTVPLFRRFFNRRPNALWVVPTSHLRPGLRWSSGRVLVARRAAPPSTGSPRHAWRSEGPKINDGRLGLEGKKKWSNWCVKHLGSKKMWVENQDETWPILLDVVNSPQKSALVFKKKERKWRW